MISQLVTPRLILRRARPDDVDDLHQVFSSPEAMRWWSTTPHETKDKTAEWLESMIAAAPETSDDFVIEAQGRVIGKAGFWRLPEIGYILHPDYWGRGLAKEALTAVIDHVMVTRDIDAITADVDPSNAASIRLLGRLGFEQTGAASRTWQVGGVWMDSLYFGLDRDRWKSLKTP
ncbi:MAG: GNAT family N-acetyltransferase [Alphaproteobacteria bacterium]|jgi:[ribosomal protein S5]-alanine N-acetyltransferase|uniref:GNAT family N-acetyltransferase n=1 Tax=Brevundimonas sp. TaxID=1871086 RepID=UPI001D3B5D4E|nr:GNAT family N-acetyltransferase [Alphaproteobacteria bacterium]MBU1520458.1 GNAT family N-acetyltransferase [Alphaproteobacteria bacterium]MBU2030223.1 GNAT family N-acetyltransferase [Alphaproteobacteria bacterium]MBU2164515.1 GNAT family N-acetyltransferase [Alphaproteobacteria bacterium]MBU2232468.1 GNAT family N-acetyltransferase [Alphaproteobacteria bacterium]